MHSQVWRNHVGIVDALLEAGADVDAQDGESGWCAPCTASAGLLSTG